MQTNVVLQDIYIYMSGHLADAFVQSDLQGVMLCRVKV